MATIELKGASFDYVERGRGETLVLVHGSASDHRTWQGQLGPLSEHFRVIAYSRRYHFPNQPIASGNDYSMPEHIADLKALIDALELSPAHLVGHSYGAFVCLLLAILAPARVRSLVLTEPPVLPLVVRIPPQPSDLLKLFLTRPLTGIAVAKLAGGGLGPAGAEAKRGNKEEALRLMGTAILGREFFEHLSRERLAQARDNFIEQELLGSPFPPLTADQVRAVHCPVLLVGGEHSPTVFRRLTSLLHGLLPCAQRIAIARASHLVHEDQPSAYTSAVLRFLSEQPSAGAPGSKPW